MGNEPGEWDLPEVLPCRECIAHIFSSPELYHLNCDAEDDNTMCDYCTDNDFECMHIPESLVDMCNDIYELRKLFFASKTAKSRALALIGLDSKVKEFSKKLKKIEEVEDEEWDDVADEEEEEGGGDSEGSSDMNLKDDSLIDLTPGKNDPLVDSILEDMEKLLAGWKKIESAYGKIEHIVGEVKELKKVLGGDGGKGGAGEDDEEGNDEDEDEGGADDENGEDSDEEGEEGDGENGEEGDDDDESEEGDDADENDEDAMERDW